MTAYQLAARDRIARGCNGFLKPQREYKVTIGVRTYHTGSNKREAVRSFVRYSKQYAGLVVILWCDGDRLRDNIQ